jgi:hypothetical protein
MCFTHGMRSSTHRGEAAEVLSTRPRESRSEADPISSTRLVDALLVGGFEVFRIDQHGTILEREGRAVVIPHGTRMRRDVVDDLRKIAGLTLPQLEKLLANR